jgi:hypothetical protein
MKKLLFPLCLVLVLAVALMPGCALFKRQSPVINSFDANPSTISAGQTSKITWNISGATSASIDQGIGNVALTGSRDVAPSATTTYTLTAINASGSSITATCQVIVSGTESPPEPASHPVVNSFTANPTTISVDSSATLSWNVSKVTSVTIDPGLGTFASSGTTLVSPAATTTYILTATNEAGSTTATAQVTVLEAYTPPPEYTPPPTTFAVTSITASVNPATFTGSCPKNFSCSAVITVNAPGTVTYQWERSDGGSSPTQTVNFAAAGSQTVTTGWPRETSGDHWVRVRTLTPNEVVSNKASFTLSCSTLEEPPPELVIFQVQSVMLDVTPTSYTGPCPAQFTCSVTITVNGPGTVTYRWERSDGTSALQNITFSAAGSKTVTTGWNPPTQFPWVHVRTLSPNEKVSTNWTVANHCVE